MRTVLALLLTVFATQMRVGPAVRYDLAIVGGHVMDPETGWTRCAMWPSGVAPSRPSQPSRCRRPRQSMPAAWSSPLDSLSSFGRRHNPESYRLDALDGVTSSLDLEVLDGNT